MTTLLMASLVAATTVNLARNLEFKGDGLGGILGWSVSKKQSEYSIVKEPNAGPDGSTALKIDFRTENFLSQGDFLLVTGEAYTVSASVRTKNLGSPTNYYIQCWNNFWEKSVCSVPFPVDTAGKWERVSWTGRLIPSIDGKYTITVRGSCTNEGASLEFALPSVVAVKPEVAAKSSAVPLGDPYRVRPVPIDRILSDIPKSDFSLTFYYSGDLDAPPREYDVVGIFSNDGKEVSTRRTVLGEDRRARLDFGSVQEYCGRLSVSVVERKTDRVVSSADYPVRLYTPLRADPVPRRLNNFVSELFRCKAQDGTWEFTLEEPGWVYIGFSYAHPSVIATIDDVAAEVIRYRSGERSETMRYLNRGRHKVEVSGVPADGVGDLRINLVKRISTTSVWSSKKRSGPYDLQYDYAKRYLFGFFNHWVEYHLRRNTDAKHEIFPQHLEERGIRLQCGVSLDPFSSVREDEGAMCSWIKATPGWRYAYGILLDEDSLNSSRRMRNGLSNACWKLVEEDDVPAVDAYICDAPSAVWTDRQSQTPEIAALVNTGRGTGMYYPEVYPAALKDPVKAHAWEDHFLKFAQSMESFVPAAHDRIVWLFGTFLGLGAWTDWSCPEADIRVLYDDFIRRIATDPQYAPYVGGIGTGFFDYSDEEMGRFMARVVRHYCIYGRTESFSARLGMDYLPAHVTNADFDEGVRHWEVHAAAKDSIAAKRLEGYGGDKGQCRKKIPSGTGDNVIVLVRQSTAPNRICQRLSGLRSGKLYSVVWCTSDYDSWIGKTAAETDFGCRAVVQGGEEIPELAYVRVRGKKFMTHRMVFRAGAGDVTLAFSDWASDREPGARVGGRTLLNYIRVMSYFNEGEEDIAALKAMFGRKNQ